MNKPEELVNKIIESLDENKGHQIVKIDLRKIENCFCSFFVICHGTSNTHVSALADGVEDKVQEDLHEKPFHTEGQRDYYQLEDFWGDGIKEEINNSEQ